MMTHCGKCGAEAFTGPHGGSVCGQCAETVTPDGYEQTREEGLARIRAEREERAKARKAGRRVPKAK